MAPCCRYKSPEPGNESKSAVHHVGVQAPAEEAEGLGDLVEIGNVPQGHLDLLSVIEVVRFQYRDNLARHDHNVMAVALSSAAPFDPPLPKMPGHLL